MRVSVVIRALNEEEHIGRLLTGITKQTRQPDEVVLVDSGSTDATVEIASRFGARIARISPDEFSFGRSLNLGISEASGELIIIPSAHVYPLFDTWIEELLRPLEDPAVALTYGRQVGDRTTRYSERRILSRWFPPGPEHRQGHPFCNNANAAIRRSVWEDLRYDEKLTGLEDLDWAKRAMDEGWHVSYAAKAVVVHVHAETWQQVVNRYRREAIAHQRIYHDQNFTIRDAVRLTATSIASDWAHAAREGVLLENLAEIPWFRIAQFYGTYQGFKNSGDVTKQLKRRFYYPERRPREDRELLATGERIDYGSPTEERPT